MIKLEVLILADIEKVWDFWTLPEHIVNWNFANADWHCPKATNDLKDGGHFNYKMASKDDKMEFDFSGVHDRVTNHEKINSHLNDGRKLIIDFEKNGNQTKLIETFEPEKTNSEDLQRQGWQAILDNFKKYVESK